jgi:hypothetical protein
MPGRINGFSLGYTAVGGIVLWSGIKGTTLSSTFRGLLQGKAPAANQEPITATAETPATAGTTAPAGNTGADSATAAANQAIGKLLAAPYGWSAGQQWADLVSLWNQESGWSNTAENPGSGAYGIAQALGHGTSGAPYPASYQAANPPAYGGSSSAPAQISWGLAYIKSTYGSPAGAWAHETADDWY